MLQLKSSMTVGLEAQRNVFMAPAGYGKTTFAASVSEYFDPTFSKKVELKDCLWWLFDMGGLDSLTARGVDVPFIDFTRVASEKDLSFQGGSLLDQAIKMTGELVTKGTVKHLIIDTGSALDKMWFMFLQARYGKDFGAYGDLQMLHTKLWAQQLRTMSCNIIMLMHIKPVNENNRKKDLALANVDWTLDTSGNSGGIYKPHCSLYSVLHRDQRLRDKPGEFTLHPYGAFGIEGKCRYPILGEKEPANLRAAYEKIRASMNSKVA